STMTRTSRSSAAVVKQASNSFNVCASTAFALSARSIEMMAIWPSTSYLVWPRLFMSVIACVPLSGSFGQVRRLPTAANHGVDVGEIRDDLGRQRNDSAKLSGAGDDLGRVFHDGRRVE